MRASPLAVGKASPISQALRYLSEWKRAYILLQWQPRIDERLAIWLNKRKREVEGGGLPISENDLLAGSRRAFYVVSELLSPALERKHVPGDDQLRLLFTPMMVRWYHEYRLEYSLDGRQERDRDPETAEEGDDEEDMPDHEPPCIWENKHEVMDVELLRWDENQGILKFTSASRYPHPVSGRMLFDHVC